MKLDEDELTGSSGLEISQSFPVMVNLNLKL